MGLCGNLSTLQFATKIPHGFLQLYEQDSLKVFYVWFKIMLFMQGFQPTLDYQTAVRIE